MSTKWIAKGRGVINPSINNAKGYPLRLCQVDKAAPSPYETAALLALAPELALALASLYSAKPDSRLNAARVLSMVPQCFTI